ncbi:hypothetical protein DEU56DRAFT_770690 [Suillus clintonianus]|uniref:uncharacterized protein n=1 Tax=Suillus clintonianus TaxID=1904413 RepID=UPI001B873372|nr:uncharacterized protein DEU56DRAFT_770690 [Suillus clintonianus]KAG2154836.1 hypothetical protein DEU56DRAFT_770690 [Suillus clintonianus]
MADFIQVLDPAKLIFAETALAFIISPFTVPAYNLPIFLFGSYVQESHDAAQSLNLFAGLLSLSIFYDVLWMIRNEQGAFLRLLTVILLLLKLPTTGSFLIAVRQRGGQFPGLGTDINGPTVWSMPGGFTSSGRDGYQTVEDDAPRAPPKVSSTPQPANQSGTYQSV